MFFLAGAAASSALDLISAIEQKVGAKGSPAPSPTTPSFDVGSSGAAAPDAPSAAPAAPLAPTTMNALLSVQGDAQTPVVNGDAFSSKLFGLLDSNGDGAISRSEMDAIFSKNGDTTKADAIFAKLDANHDGSVNPDELTNALSGQGQGGQDDGGQQVQHHRHHRHGLGGLGGANSPMGGSNDPFSTSSAGSSNDPFAGDNSQTVTNTDGSSTTTITYADGSQVSMTTPAASSSGSNPSAWAHNVIERMIQRQAQMMAASPAGQGFALSA